MCNNTARPSFAFFRNRKRFSCFVLFLNALLLLALAQEPPSTPAPTNAASPHRLLVSEVVTSPLVIQKIPAKYPEAALKARIQGTVVLRIVIDLSGAVQDVKVVSGDPTLADAATQAVRQWKYKPYQIPPAAPKPEAPPDSSATSQLPLQHRPVVVHAQAGVSLGLLIRKVRPVYPKDARMKGIQGTVRMRAEISKTGDVVDLELIDGPIELAVSAVNAVRQWKYKPYLLNGAPVAVLTEVVCNYTLTL